MIRKLFLLFLVIGFIACFDNNSKSDSIALNEPLLVKPIKVSKKVLPLKDAMRAFNRFIKNLSANEEQGNEAQLLDQARLYFPDSTIFANHFLFGREITYRDSFRILFYEFSPATTANSHIYLGSFHPSGSIIDLLKVKELSFDGNISINLIDDEVVEFEYADFYLNDSFYQSNRYLCKVPDSLKNLSDETEHMALRHYAKQNDFEQTTFYENYRINEDGYFERLSNEFQVIEARKYPATSTRVLSYQELDRYKLPQLALMRNEIYASHGYIFTDKKLRRYFNRKKWYDPVHSQVEEFFNDIELINLAKIQKMEMTY